jgi:type I restriction enzyme S subunit
LKHAKEIKPESLNNHEEKRFIQSGDILWNSTGTGTIGRLAIASDNEVGLTVDSHVTLVRPSRVLPKYIWCWLAGKEVYGEIENDASGSTNQIELTKAYALNLPTPLPPLAEQHRIVKKVESLFAEVDELEAKLNRQTKLDEKLQVAVNAEVQQAPDAEASTSAWSFIASNFDTLYHTPEAIDNLKKNILNEAVRGRLVSQDPNDEPASELLKKIKAEKERLFEEGEIRKPKDLPPVKEGEDYFEAPSNWKWIRLGEIGDWGAGATPSRSNSEYYGGDIPWLKTGELNDGFINKAEEFITEKGFKNSSVRMCKPGDVLIAMYGATIGKLGILEFKATTNQACCACTTFEGFYNIYLYYYLRSMRDNFRNQGAGGAQPNISKTKIEHTVLPLPPLEEQYRIVRRIEELFAICDQFKAQLEQRQAVNERLVKGLVGEVLEGS